MSRDHPVMSLVPFARIEATNGQQHPFAGKTPGCAQRRAIARREAVGDCVRHDDDPFGRYIGPGEHRGARVARDAQHQIGHLDREASQPRRRGPDLDPVRLDDEPGMSEAGNCSRQRREMEVTAEHDVWPLFDRRGDGADGVE